MGSAYARPRAPTPALAGARGRLISPPKKGRFLLADEWLYFEAHTALCVYRGSKRIRLAEPWGGGGRRWGGERGGGDDKGATRELSQNEGY